MDFLTGLILGAFLTAALFIYWHHFGGAAWFAGWRQRQIDKL